MKTLIGAALVLFIQVSAFAYEDFSKITVWDSYNKVTKIYNESQINRKSPYIFYEYANVGDIIQVYPKSKIDSIYAFFSPCSKGPSVRQGSTPLNEFKIVKYPVKYIDNAQYAVLKVDQSWNRCEASIYLSINPKTFEGSNKVVFAVAR